VNAPTARSAAPRNPLERALRACELAAATLGGIMMLVAMVLTTVDAVLRYAFNAPLSFAFYLNENYLMVGMMCLPLAWGFRAGGFIRIMAVALALPARLRDLLLRIGLMVGAVYCAALAVTAFEHFWGVVQRGDVQMGVIDWPVSWSWVWVPIGVGLFSLRLLATALGPASELHQAHDDTAEDAV
jgi:TRAP-type C4-dicarboxylate transport system permease small subunit